VEMHCVMCMKLVYCNLCLFLLRDLSLVLEMSLSVLSFFDRLGLIWGGGSGGSSSFSGVSFVVWYLEAFGCLSYSPVFLWTPDVVGSESLHSLSRVRFSISSLVSIWVLSLRVSSLSFSTNSCGWRSSPSCIWGVSAGQVSVY